MIDITYIPCIKLEQIEKGAKQELITLHPYLHVLGLTDTVIEVDEMPLLSSWVLKNIRKDIEKIVVI